MCSYLCRCGMCDPRLPARPATRRPTPASSNRRSQRRSTRCRAASAGCTKSNSTVACRSISETPQSPCLATSRIHLEIFGAAPSLTPGVVGADHPSPHLPAGEAGTGPTVTFVRSGLSVPWNARFQNLLELTEACAVPAKWSCRTGVCHNCESALAGGDVSYSPDPLDPPAAGTC
jgi:hypothetical protein